MQKILISGCNGRMGRAVEALCAADLSVEVVAGADVMGAGEHPFPVFSSPFDFDGPVDVIIDFSSPAALPTLLDYARARAVPLVLATTGYSPDDVARLAEAAAHVPIFRSGNMSLGINLLLDLVRRAAAVLGDDCDIEIIERHHNKKVDAPSGTALMLADAVKSALPYAPERVYDRTGVRRPRGRAEIGISSVRGGTIIGDHEVMFAGRDEVIEITHHAASREIFATGALRAAKFLVGKSPGLYDMSMLMDALS